MVCIKSDISKSLDAIRSLGSLKLKLDLGISLYILELVFEELLTSNPKLHFCFKEILVCRNWFLRIFKHQF